MTIETIDEFALFARPGPDGARLTRFFGEITSLYAVSVLQARSQRSELADQLITTLEARPSQPVWDLSLGQLRLGMNTPNDPGLVQFALHLAPAAPWEAGFTEPQRLRVGPSVIDGVRTITHDGAGTYTCAPLTQPRELRTIANPFGTSVVLGRDALPGWLEDEAADGESARCAALWQDALDLIADHAPSYAHWVQRAVRAVIPVDNPPELLISGSDDRRPGVITASVNTTVDGTAEILVHEATHQYMYAATKVSRLDDGTDQTLYYSPVKGADRPVAKILVAFHAVGNVLLLAKALIDTGQDRDHYWQRNIERLTPQCAELDEVLTHTTALTHVGTCLHRPLRAELADHGLLTPP